MIKEVYIEGKTVSVRYESEKWIQYRRAIDIPKEAQGIRVLPQTVIRFMRNNPNKVVLVWGCR